MASLGYEWFSVRGEALGEPYKFKSDVSVDRDGLFSVTIPAELVETARANRKEAACIVRKMRVNWAVQGRDLGYCRSFIESVAQDFLKCEVIREHVIVYRTETSVAYWKKADGQIVPNGNFDPEYSQQQGTWGGSGGCNNDVLAYTVGIVAGVYTKVIARRDSGDQILFERFEDDDETEFDTWAAKLNSFLRVAIDLYDLPSMDSVPYTEQAAKFFYETMLTMCKLSDNIEIFFSNPENIHRAIETHSGFMLPAETSKERAA